MSKTEPNSFFEDTEVWNPSKFCYPTWNDIMRAYLSRVKNGNSYTSATDMYEVATIVIKIWTNNDGCPKSKTKLKPLLETTLTS